ncbi:MAG: hypothetical protein KBT28_08615 [Bacteroidales bacterium]|nr:hypothetical protein [Candidatus Colimorpha merdihippi]
METKSLIYNEEELNDLIREEKRKVEQQREQADAMMEKAANTEMLISAVALLQKELAAARAEKEECLLRTKELEKDNEKLEAELSRLKAKQSELKNPSASQQEEYGRKFFIKVFGQLLKGCGRWGKKRKEDEYDRYYPFTLLDVVPQEVKDKIESLNEGASEGTTINNYDIHDNHNVNQ